MGLCNGDTSKLPRIHAKKVIVLLSMNPTLNMEASPDRL